MTLILYFVQFGQTPLYKACSNGQDKVVQALLDHGVQVDVPDKVSDISCIHFKLCNTTEVNEATLVTQENNNMMCIYCHCSAMISIIEYQFYICNKSYSLLRRGIVSSILSSTLNLPQLKNTLNEINSRN